MSTEITATPEEIESFSQQIEGMKQQLGPSLAIWTKAMQDQGKTEAEIATAMAVVDVIPLVMIPAVMEGIRQGVQQGLNFALDGASETLKTCGRTGNVQGYKVMDVFTDSLREVQEAMDQELQGVNARLTALSMQKLDEMSKAAQAQAAKKESNDESPKKPSRKRISNTTKVAAQ